ncbi:MAG: potassium transporter TrkG [Eubacteriales bacterium]|nr:potassium transporter TrkG [Eubacteriales bacterium]
MQLGQKNTENKIVERRHLASAQIIILGFLMMILAGTLLLMLPVSSKGQESAGFFDSLFTAVSATCVTGLVVQDTATYWSGFGQAVILILIQIGGMGVVTVSFAISLFSGKKIGLMQRSVMQDSVSAHQVGGIARLTKFIVITSLCIEAIGALLLMPTMIGEFGLGRGIWYSFFHSISAFCNAGFDLFGVKEHFSSLTSLYNRPFFNIVIMLLITVGGLGFLTWEDIKSHKLNFKKYAMQSKVILSTSAVLVAVPAVCFFIFEYAYLPLGERLLASLFQSVTTRTAGFNTMDLNALSESGKFLFIMLMLIGGSPGSTAGGMKTTTIAVLFSLALSVFMKKNQAQFFGRRVPDEAVKAAATILLLYVFLASSSAMVIALIEGIPILTALFETASAIGTVGLTLGITPSLGIASRIIIMILMYLGRVGSLTLIFATLNTMAPNVSNFPQEKITVG